MDGMLVLVAILGLGVYFFPAMIASQRRHHNSSAIFVLNLLLGWTLLGWIGALVWSCTATAHTQVQRPSPSSSRSWMTTLATYQFEIGFWAVIILVWVGGFFLLTP